MTVLFFAKGARTMEKETRNDIPDTPEGAVIVALDSREEGFLFGAVELRNGEERWLEYELEPDQEGDAVSLYREEEYEPMMEYRARGRRLDTLAGPGRLLLLWNRGKRALTVDGEPLDPGNLTASAPKGVTPWLLRLAPWLLERKQQTDQPAD